MAVFTSCPAYQRVVNVKMIYKFDVFFSVAAGRYSHVSSMGDVHEHVQVNGSFKRLLYYIVITLHPADCEVLRRACMFICLSVCQSVRIFQKPESKFH